MASRRLVLILLLAAGGVAFTLTLEGCAYESCEDKMERITEAEERIRREGYADGRYDDWEDAIDDYCDSCAEFPATCKLRKGLPPLPEDFSYPELPPGWPLFPTPGLR